MRYTLARHTPPPKLRQVKNFRKKYVGEGQKKKSVDLGGESFVIRGEFFLRRVRNLLEK